MPLTYEGKVYYGSPFGPASPWVQEERMNEIYEEMSSLHEGMLIDEEPDFKELLRLIDNGDVTEARKACTDLIESLKCRENELIELDNRLTFIDS